MKTSDSVANIAPALVKAQHAIGAVKKDKVGKVQTKTGGGYEYRYSDLASVIEAVKGPLNEAGIAFVQAPSGDSTGVMVTTTLLHTSGEWISETVYMPVAGGGAQAYGSAITYAKRYGLQSMTGLPSEDDDGAKATENAPAQPQRPNTAKQVAVDAFDQLDPDEQAFLRERAIEIIAFCEDGQTQRAISYIEEQRFDTEEKLAIWSLLPANVRGAIKKQQREVTTQ